MVDKDGAVKRQTCGLCHTAAIQVPEDGVRTGRAELHTESIRLCAGCHPEHIDYFEPGHIGARVPARMQARLAVASRGRCGRLPLGAGNRVVCSTCHNPHPAGVFPAESELACGALTSEEEREGLQLRGLGKGLCGACHNE